jgi:hypothetical protein
MTHPRYKIHEKSLIYLNATLKNLELNLHALFYVSFMLIKHRNNQFICATIILSIQHEKYSKQAVTFVKCPPHLKELKEVLLDANSNKEYA